MDHNNNNKTIITNLTWAHLRNHSHAVTTLETEMKTAKETSGHEIIVQMFAELQATGSLGLVCLLWAPKITRLFSNSVLLLKVWENVWNVYCKDCSHVCAVIPQLMSHWDDLSSTNCLKRLNFYFFTDKILKTTSIIILRNIYDTSTASTPSQRGRRGLQSQLRMPTGGQTCVINCKACSASLVYRQVESWPKRLWQWWGNRGVVCQMWNDLETQFAGRRTSSATG